MTHVSARNTREVGKMKLREHSVWKYDNKKSQSLMIGNTHCPRQTKLTQIHTENKIASRGHFKHTGLQKGQRSMGQ